MAKGRPIHLTKQLVVRVDDSLLSRLEADARANGRTVAQTVRFLLDQTVSAQAT